MLHGFDITVIAGDGADVGCPHIRCRRRPRVLFVGRSFVRSSALLCAPIWRGCRAGRLFSPTNCVPTVQLFRITVIARRRPLSAEFLTRCIYFGEIISFPQHPFRGKLRKTGKNKKMYPNDPLNPPKHTAVTQNN